MELHAVAELVALLAATTDEWCQGPTPSWLEVNEVGCHVWPSEGRWNPDGYARLAWVNVRRTGYWHSTK